SIGSLHINYSPAGLVQKKIKNIEIADLQFYLELLDRKLTIPGLAESLPDSKEQKALKGLMLPMDLEEMQVKNSALNIGIDGRQFFIPFDLVLKQKFSGRSSYYTAVMRIFPASEKIAIAADINLETGTGLAKLTADSLKIEKFTDLLNTIADIEISGLGNIDADWEISLPTLKMNSAHLTLSLHPFHLKFKDFEIKTQQDGLQPEPVQLTLEFEEDLKFKVENIFLTRPIRVKLATTGVFGSAAEKISGSGMFLLSLLQIPSMKLLAPLEVNGIADYGYNRDTRAWYFDIKENTAAARQNIRLQYNDSDVVLGAQEFSLSGNGVAGNGTVKFSAAFPESRVNQKNIRGNAGLLLTGDAFIRSGPAADGQQIEAAGLLTVDKGTVLLQDKEFALQDIQGAIPWQWPASARERTGSISIADMIWKNTALGGFSSGITLQDTTYSLHGSYKSSLLDGLVLDLYGRAGLSNGKLTASLEVQTGSALFSAGELGRIAPALSHTMLKGRLDLQGAFKYDGIKLKGDIQGNLQDGRLQFTKKKYVFEDIALAVKLPHLPQIRTGPGQQLRFARASLENISFSDGKVVWQLEPDKTLFVENSIFHWAGGNIQVNDLRLAPGKDHQFVSILCEKLNLIEVLQQLGIENAAGEGTVSGKIPVLLKKKTIEFKNGILSSLPGEGGRIRIAAFDMLAAGIPKNAPQFGQIDFAAEALKDFQYNRVTLLLNTEGENLLMQMQMEGKPLKPLPFTYDSKTGILKRADNAKQGITQPIRLDVNLRLPLNRLLGYSGKIQEILDKIQ
ncbi:MAG: YdbH domain-containing protein, partial [Desulfobulbales bacterium]|nr:YdbH domain-containing protein [Desulfobulbales bacterium]